MAKPIILCVDDDAQVLRALREELRAGYGGELTVEIALGSEAAIRLAQQLTLEGGTVQLVLAELHLLGLGCEQVIGALRQIHSATRCVLITNGSREDKLASLLNRTAVDFILPKPWPSPHLLEAVAEALSRYERERSTSERLDLIETLEVGVLALARAPDEAQLCTSLLEIAADYAAADGGAVVSRDGEHWRTVSGLGVLAGDAPWLKDALAHEAFEAVVAEGGWRAFELSDTAHALQTVSSSVLTFVQRVSGAADGQHVLILRTSARSFHRSPGAFASRLAVVAEPLLKRAKELAAIEEGLASTQADEDSYRQQLAEHETALREVKRALDAAIQDHSAALTSQACELNAQHERELASQASDLAQLKERLEAASQDHASTLSRQTAELTAQHERQLANLAADIAQLQESYETATADAAELTRSYHAALGREREHRALHQAELAERDRAIAEAAQREQALDAQLQASKLKQAELDNSMAEQTETMSAIQESDQGERGRLQEQVAQLSEQLQQAKEQFTRLNEAAVRSAAEHSVRQAEWQITSAAHARELAAVQERVEEEHSEMRNQILGLTAQLQGAGRSGSQESTVQREQMQAFALKLAEAEGQLEAMYRHAAAAQSLTLITPEALQQQFPISVAAMLPARPVLRHLIWTKSVNDSLLVAVGSVGTGIAAVQHLAWLQATLNRISAPPSPHDSPSPDELIDLVVAEWQGEFSGVELPSLGLCQIDAERLVLTYRGLQSQLLLIRGGASILLDSAQAAEHGGLVLEAEDRFVLAPIDPFAQPNKRALADLVELATQMAKLSAKERSARLLAHLRTAAGEAVDLGGAAVLLEV
jgi:CheY-like chemotaxis protein